MTGSVKIKDVDINISGGDMSAAEVSEYIDRGRKKHSGIYAIDIAIDGEDVELTYHVAPMHFDRIRRITGYLVGTLDRFNNGKRAEVNDRVKHGI